jgi:DNA-binding SARP family transcriptional activator
MPNVPPPPAVQVIRARALIADGRASEALAILDGIDWHDTEQPDLSLGSLARASALQTLGRTSELWDEVVRLTEMRHTSAVVERLGHAWRLILAAFVGESISDARSALRDLVAQTSSMGLRYFAGVALHNEATAALAQGDYEQAYRLASQARVELTASPAGGRVESSSTMTQAVAAFELGLMDEGLSLARTATSDSNADPDVLADAIYVAAVTGDADRAAILESRLARKLAGGATHVGSRSQAAYARIACLVTQGCYSDASLQADELAASAQEEMDSVSRSAYIRAMLATISDESSAVEEATQSLAAAESQNAWRWEARLRILEAAARRDAVGLRRWLVDTAAVSRLALLELAEVLTSRLDILNPVPSELLSSIRGHPHRWLPVLSRELNSDRPSADVAAQLVSAYGGIEHAPQLVAFERRAGGGPRKRGLSRALIHRVSPTLQIHDLGRASYEMAGRRLRSSDRRRKAASLLLFLATRTRQPATREQIMEVLWPNQSPSSAVNSLHQTLHFVRRDIAPWHEEGITAEYVPMQSDLVFLDPELVQVDSVSFLRQANDAIRSGDLTRSGGNLVRLYTGRFAPEFEYEDWAADWRSLLHTTYLHLAHATATAMTAAGLASQAVEVLARAIEIDGQAFELQVTLIRLLNRLGARDAALEQYGHYVAIMRRELDIKAPSFDDLVDGAQDVPP